MHLLVLRGIIGLAIKVVALFVLKVMVDRVPFVLSLMLLVGH